MNNLKVTDELLYRYMPVVDNAIIEAIEKNVDRSHHFSDSFEKKMRSLIQKEKLSWVLWVQKYTRKIAVFVILLVSAALLMTMSVKAYRVKFFETFKSFLGDAMRYDYEENISSEGIQYREPKYVPEGYRELEREKSVSSLKVIYEKSEGEWIRWKQNLAHDGFSMVLDTEYDEKEVKTIGGVEVEMFIYLDGSIMAYFEYEESVYVVTADKLSKEEFCRVIESAFD